MRSSSLTSISAMTTSTVPFLPFEVPVKEKDDLEDEFIVEPGAEEIANRLLPVVLRLKIYTTLLDSSAAENAARTIAMRVVMVKDNAIKVCID